MPSREQKGPFIAKRPPSLAHKRGCTSDRAAVFGIVGVSVLLPRHKGDRLD